MEERRARTGQSASQQPVVNSDRGSSPATFRGKNSARVSCRQPAESRPAKLPQRRAGRASEQRPSGSAAIMGSMPSRGPPDDIAGRRAGGRYNSTGGLRRAAIPPRPARRAGPSTGPSRQPRRAASGDSAAPGPPSTDMPRAGRAAPLRQRGHHGLDAEPPDARMRRAGPAVHAPTPGAPTPARRGAAHPLDEAAGGRGDGTRTHDFRVDSEGTTGGGGYGGPGGGGSPRFLGGGGAAPRPSDRRRAVRGGWAGGPRSRPVGAGAKPPQRSPHSEEQNAMTPQTATVHWNYHVRGYRFTLVAPRRCGCEAPAAVTPPRSGHAALRN